MKRLLPAVLMMIGPIVLALVALAGAQVRYVDENGVVHWVASPEQVPERYRGNSTSPRLPALPTVPATPGTGTGESQRQPMQKSEPERMRQWYLTVAKIVGDYRYQPGMYGPFPSEFFCQRADVGGLYRDRIQADALANMPVGGQVLTNTGPTIPGEFAWVGRAGIITVWRWWCEQES